MTTFDELTRLRDEWLACQPLNQEHEARLWKKIRLEWNYHSNHIEGNTLTYGETELLLLHDRTTGNHTHREYLEMKAHDVGIEHVRTLAADPDRLLTEGDIRDLNRIILKEPFWKAAETPDGQSTRKEIIPGQYKTSPNNVRLPSGGIFFFASVEDTPPRMAGLSDWMRQQLEKQTLHPVAFAAKLHHDFVLIHPFDDGNGRVARLLVNYVLMRSGYLPLIVRTEDKANYLTALHLADAGELSALISYFHERTEWSLRLGLRAAKGESIEEPTDVEKEIAIFVRSQDASRKSQPQVSREALKELIAASLRPFISSVESKLQSMAPLFRRMLHRVHFVGTGVFKEALERVPFDEGSIFHPEEEVRITILFQGYLADSPSSFSLDVQFGLRFQREKYSIIYADEVVLSRDYSKWLMKAEYEELSARIARDALEEVKRLSRASGL